MLANLSNRVLMVLADRDFIVSNMPFVVGVKDDKVTLQFSRFLFGFKDTYSISVEGGSAGRGLHLTLQGKRSTIVIEYVLRDSIIKVNVSYRGPRG